MTDVHDDQSDRIAQLTGKDDTREYITVMINQQLFGMAIDQVHDVFSPQNMTPVPKSRPEIAGVLNLRGRIVTAIDMRERLGLEKRPDDAVPMAVGIEHKGESYGLVIDEVGEVMRLPIAGIEPPPSNLDSRWSEIALGVHRLEGALIVILDVERVLSFGPIRRNAA
ncbi:MAG: chemotaxis protein CheW [Pseudomonadota bacterium]